MGVGWGNVVPSAGLVRSHGLAVSGCGSGWICGGCDGCGPGFGAFGRSGPLSCALASFGFWFAWLLLGRAWRVAPRGGGLLGNGVRWRRRWLGGQARRAVWRAGLLGCCGYRRCRCADACWVVRECVCAALGFG